MNDRSPRSIAVISLSSRRHLSGIWPSWICRFNVIFLFRQFFMTLPDALIDAARIDGASPMRFFRDIVLPHSKTNLAALFVITFIYGWNQYLWPLLIVSDARPGTAVAGIKGMILPLGQCHVALAGRTITLGIRPEHIALSSQAEGGVPFTVQTLEMLGADNLAHGRFGEQKVIVRLAHQHRPAAGAMLWLHLPPENLHFFDGETGLRL